MPKIEEEKGSRFEDEPFSAPETPESLEIVASPDQLAEQTLDQGLDRLGAKAEGVAQALDSVEKTVPGKKSEKLREKLNRTFRRSLEVVKMAALMTALSYIPDHGRPRHPVEKNVDSKGEVTYKHVDKETTQILDYLSGKSELPREIRLKFFREEMAKRTELENKIPKDYNEYDEDQLRSFLGQEFLNAKTPHARQIAETILDKGDLNWLDSFVSSKSNFDPKLYQNLWEIEQEVGNPKIRWGFTDNKGEYRGHFSPDNTIYIDPPVDLGDPSDVFVAEAAHAKQVRTKPFSSSVKFVKDMVRTVFTAIRENKSLVAAQKELYSIPGTLEHEAHNVIEPELKKKLQRKE